MKLRLSSTRNAPGRQTGSYLLEALIAILIFAFGVLGLIGLLGSSIRVTNDARYRSEAANLAGAMIADMWTMTAAQMDTQFGSGGAKLTAWQDKAQGPAAFGGHVSAHSRPDAARPFSRKPNGRGHGLLADARRNRKAPAPDDRADRQEPDRAMTRNERTLDADCNRGVGLIEVMISIIIAMLLVLVIYQVYEISEGQKRTITAGSDAQQNASYGLYRARPRPRHGRQRHRVGRREPRQLRAAAPDSGPHRGRCRRPAIRTRSRCSTAARVRCRRPFSSSRLRPRPSRTWCRGRSASARTT